MASSSSTNPEEMKTVQLLAKGLLEIYEPPLATINTHLKELTEKQDAVHGMITSERRKLEDLQNDAMLDALLADIATNKEKLVCISGSMMGLHKRVQSLQTRAANVEKAAKIKAANQSKTQPSVASLSKTQSCTASKSKTQLSAESLCGNQSAAIQSKTESSATSQSKTESSAASQSETESSAASQSKTESSAESQSKTESSAESQSKTESSAAGHSKTSTS